MQEIQRKLARRRLDREMRPFRIAAARKGGTTDNLLRAVRKSLNIPAREIAARMGVNRSVVFELEASERRRTISLKSLARFARAMDCQVVYGVVPEKRKTLEKRAEERFWREQLGK